MPFEKTQMAARKRVIFVIVAAVIAGFNCIPILINRQFPKFERILWRAILIATMTYLVILVLSMNGLTLKSALINQAIGVMLIVGYFLYYSLGFPNRKKFFIVALSVPVMAMALYTQLLSGVTLQHSINADLNITVSDEGFLACGQIIRLNKSQLGIFNQELRYDSDQCLHGISKIEIIRFDKNLAVLLLYHAERLETETPFRYEIRNVNYW